MTHIPELFERVLDWHRTKNRAVPRDFRPGLTDAEIDKELSSLPFVFPDSVRDLYKWHDGMDLVDDPADTTFFENLWMFPLERSVGVYRVMQETRSSFDCAENWFPIFEDDCANCWAVECGKERSNDAPVVIFTNVLANNGIAFDSVEQMLLTMIEALETGIIVNGDDGFLETDYGKLRPLMQSMNPGASEYWKNPNNPYGPPDE